jgi:hypothetical protein
MFYGSESPGATVVSIPNYRLGHIKVTGFITGSLVGQPQCASLSRVMQLVSAVSNVLLNVFGSLSLVISLLLYKRMIISRIREDAYVVRHQLQIVSILLESAAVNTPILVIGVIGIGLGREFGYIVTAVRATCQVCRAFNLPRHTPLSLTNYLPIFSVICLRGNLGSNSTRASDLPTCLQ